MSIGHWINGETYSPSDRRTAPIFDPAHGEKVNDVVLANPDDVDRAVAAAHEAFGSWSQVSSARKQTILFNFRELVNARKDELAQLITLEHGKVISDAAGEIARGQEVLEFALSFPELLKGDYSSQVSTDVDVYSTREPLGPVAIICPFNFPAMVPMWFFPIAIAAGNTVVIKPSEKVPSALLWLAELFTEAGLPPGVFNVVQGDREAVEHLVEHPDIEAVSFVGSTPIARDLYMRGTRAGKRVQALGGAKNHMLVLPDADLDQVADAALNAAFGSAGERCMAISVLVVIDSVADDVVSRIEERIAEVRVGDGRDDPDMGPLITAEHRHNVASYIDEAQRDGANVVVDGRGLEVPDRPHGFWLGPTLLDRVPQTSRAYTEEIFGPVLSIIRVKTYDDGVELINSGPFGNGTAIFTRDGGAARQFSRDVQVGMVGVNVPIPVPVATYSFGGWRDSIFGDTKAYGPEGFRFFTREKAVTVRWADPSGDRGLNLGFPQND